MTPHPEAPLTIADWQYEFLERSGALSDLTGLPPSFVKVLAWLVVCEPAHQTTEQLRGTLGLSAAAISSATTTLIGIGLVERLTPPGERRYHYRIHPQGWEQLLRIRLEAMTQMRKVTQAALQTAPRAQSRLSGLHDIYASFEQQLAELCTPPARHSTVGAVRRRENEVAEGRGS